MKLKTVVISNLVKLSQPCWDLSFSFQSNLLVGCIWLNLVWPIRSPIWADTHWSYTSFHSLTTGFAALSLVYPRNSRLLIGSSKQIKASDWLMRMLSDLTDRQVDTPLHSSFTGFAFSEIFPHQIRSPFPPSPPSPPSPPPPLPAPPPPPPSPISQRVGCSHHSLTPPWYFTSL